MCETENLIISVEKHPCLWDVSNKDFHNRDIRDLAWEQVCNEVVHDWETCRDKVNKCAVLRKRWTHIRDYYRKDLQKFKKGNAKKQKKYVYANMLNFLAPLFDKRNCRGNSKTEAHKEVKIKQEDCNFMRSPSPEVLKRKTQQPNMEDIPCNIKRSPSPDVLKRKKPNIEDIPCNVKRSPSLDVLRGKKPNNEDNPNQISNVSLQRDETNVDKNEDDDTKFLLSFRTYMRRMNMHQKIDFQLGMLQLVKTITMDSKYQ